MAELDYAEMERIIDALETPEWMTDEQGTRRGGGMPAIHWAKDAKQPFTPKWIVEGVIAESSLTIPFGEPGCGKTNVMIDMAVSVAAGEPNWLGLEVKRATVLIVDEESGYDRLSGRIYSTKRGHDSPEDIPLGYVTLYGFNLRNARSVDVLRDTITESGAKLVIIDTLSDICAGADENSVQEMLPALIALRRIAEELEVGIVVIHHANKSGKYRGTSALKGKCDYMIKVESDGAQINLAGEKGRDGDNIKISARAFWSGGMFNLSKIEIDKSEEVSTERVKPLTGAKKFVMDFYIENQEADLSLVPVQPQSKYAFTTIRTAAYDLVEMKRLVNKSTGSGRSSVIRFAIA